MRIDKKKWMCMWAVLAMASALSAQVTGADNQLTPREKKEGWILLFDGKSTKDWMTSPTWESCPEALDHETINPHNCPNLDSKGDDLVYQRPWQDFVFKTDFKIGTNTNSGVMVRIWPLKPLPGRDVEYNSLEIQILDSQTATYYDTGAVFDLVRPTKNTMKPIGEWNHYEIRCDKNLIDVWLNGVHVTHMDLNEWTQPYERPDGSAHKFNVAWKYHSRTGYIGLQKHVGDCWFKNIKLKPLD